MRQKRRNEKIIFQNQRIYLRDQPIDTEFGEREIGLDFGFFGFFRSQTREIKLVSAPRRAFGIASGGFDFARHIFPRRTKAAVAANFGAHRFFVRQIAAEIERFALAAQVVEIAALDRLVNLLLDSPGAARLIGDSKRQFHAHKRRTSRAQVAPSVKLKIMPIQDFEVAIIGGGQGAALARMLAEKGKRVALIEQEWLGGSCVNRGCTPTKAHLAAAKRARDARTAGLLGVEIGEVSVDLRAVVARTNAIVADFRAEIGEKLGLETLEVVFGVARFSGPKALEVRCKNGEIRHLRASQIVIATGTRAQIPGIEGLESVETLGSRSLLQLEILPQKLLILGGGYIACEFAQMFARFGSTVCIAQNGAQLLTREDGDVADEIAAILRREDIEIRLACQVHRVEKTSDGLRCHVRNGAPIEATHLLLAVGQTPNVEALNLQAAGIQSDEKGFIRADEWLEAAPGIHVLGDVKGGPAFTHIAFDDARILREILLGNGRRSIKNRLVPYCVFTDPQLGRVGMTEAEAREAKREIRVAKLPCSETARGIESGEAAGFLKAIVDAKTDQILGGAFLCRDGGEMIAVLQMAMAANLPYTALRDGVFAHPTWAESLNNLFAAMDRAENCKI